MTVDVDKYIIEDNGTSKVNFQLLYGDLTEMSGFLREKRRKDLYDRVVGIVEVRNNLKNDPEGVPF